MRRAIKAHLRDFVALLVLLLIAIGVSSFILGHQRLYLPSWVPGIGTDFYEVNAEFSTAQAVVPGQGQTVNVAGVPVGEIGSVELKNGVAVVQLKIRRKYAPIYRDATMLLRPKTGLKDMVVEMDPGTKPAGALPAGATIPIQNTAPDVNLDEVLASLDTDTRAYLQILVNGGGRALRGRASVQLRATLKRFEPTNRDLARITGLLSERRRNLRRVVHNFALLTGELGTRDRQLSELVDSANANFRALASQDQGIRESLRLLPGTLSAASDTLGKADRFARAAGPSFQALRPFARDLGPALRSTRPFLRRTTPVIRDQLRPFARDVRPTVRSLRTAAGALRPTAPRLTRVFRFLNAALNELAYNPPGPEEGFLFWASWINHTGATIFNTQDAHGAIRRGLIITSCASLGLLLEIIKQNPQLAILFNLLGAPAPETVCPTQGTKPAVRAKGGGRRTADGGRQTGGPPSPTPGKPLLPAMGGGR